MIFLTLFLEFFKIGLFTFGGGYAMIPLVKEVVKNHDWLTADQFESFLGVCESTPGPIAINMATYVGSIQGGVLGAILATLGVVLPSFFIILLIAAALKNFVENKYFKGFLQGVKPVVIALIVSTGIVMTAEAIGYAAPLAFSFDPVSMIILALLIIIYFVAKYLFGKKLSAVWLILISAALGIGVSWLFTL